MNRPVPIFLVSALLALLSTGSPPPARAADITATSAESAPKKTVEIRGEVAQPGIYGLDEGETLSSLILRAGGYTDNAWLPGAVLTREPEKQRQAKELAGVVQRMEEAARAAGSEETESGPMRRYLDDLRNLFPPGRVPVRLSHPRLMINGPDDLPLQDGDLLFLPSAPRTVRVTGSVGHPGEYPPSPGARLSAVAKPAGGILPEADPEGTILLKADGTARMLTEPWAVWDEAAGRWELSLFRRDRPRVEAGDTVFVPRDPGRIPWPGGADDYRRTILRILAPGFPPRPPAAGVAPLAFPSNSGLTGLLETPTARVMETNRYRLGFGYVKPYRYFYGSVSPFPRFEIGARLTTIVGVPLQNDPFPSHDYDDKAIDFKIQMLPEGKYRPALSLVVLDPHGTRLYASQAIVASKQVYPFDLSLGVGNGWLGSRSLPGSGDGFKMEILTDPEKWAKESRLFGGVEFTPIRNLSLVAEYSSVRHDSQTSDPAREKYFRAPTPSPFQYGIRWKPFRWAELDLSYQRGNQFAGNVSVSFDIGKPLLPIYDPPYREPAERRVDPLSDRLTAALLASGFSDVEVESDGMTMRIEAQNDRYFFPARAIQVILDSVAAILPRNIDYIRIVLKENGNPLVEFVGTGHGIAGLHDGTIPSERFPDITAFRTVFHWTPSPGRSVRRPFDYGIRPSFESYLNDPSGFYRYRIGAAGSLSYHPFRGNSLILGVEAYPVNTVTTFNTPLSNPVRSDLPLYKRESVSLSRFLVDQVARVRGPLFGRISAGILEIQYSGLDAGLAFPVGGGRLLLGGSGSIVRKRKPDSLFALIPDRTYHTAFLNGRLNIPEWELYLDGKAGRFLAGDLGGRITVAKSIHGVLLSAWVGITDTSGFTDPLNRGYHDKGIAVEIPIRLFLGRDSKTAYRFSLSPWTRDPGQDIEHHSTLFDFLGRNLPVFLDKDARTLYKR